MAKIETTLTQRQLEVIAGRFGGCGCEAQCQVEQYGDVDMQNKPNGRFSVCELLAAQRGIKLPAKKEEP